ncbi:MAG: hypothetical protein KDE51_06020, partial [Anaerolineales bacterium]|nr:hypothetical protein [Anaerolineales bacterium]
MIPDKFTFLHTPLFAVVWFVPIAFLLLLRESPQLFAGVGFVVGLLLGLYGIGALFLLWRSPYLRSASPLDLGLLLMFSALVISAVFSIDPSRSWRLVWNWGACMVAFYVALTLLRAGGSVQQLIKVFLTVISILVIAGYQQLFVWLWRWYDVFGTSLRPMVSLIPRVHGVTGSANILAFFIVVGIALALTYRTADTQQWPWAARLWIIFTLPVFFVTRSRSSFIALAAAMAIIALGYLWIRLRGRLSVQIITRVGSGLLVLGVVTIGLIFLLRPATSLGERNVSYRLQLWQFGLQNWLDYPLMGSGADTFATTILLRDETVPPAFPL